MKIYFYNKFSTVKENVTTFTYELIKHLARKNGHKIANDMNDADIIAVSLAHHSEIKDLRKIRKKTTKPIIAGGHASYAPAPILCYCDFVNLGHGFKFFEECQKIDDLYDKEYIYHREKPRGTYSQYINWIGIPLIQIGKNSYSYLWSVGCKHKCNFCNTSWINKYQVNPSKLMLEVVRYHTRNNQLYIITNDYSDSDTKRAVSDATVKDYIKDPAKFQNIVKIRTGIESVTYETRRWLGKNITDNEVVDFFRKTKENRKTTSIFLIAGLDTQEQWEDFMIILDKDYEKRPRITVIVNYFAPNIGTPLEDWDITKTIPLDFKKIAFFWYRMNGRVKICNSNAIKPYTKLTETLIERADNIDDLEKIFEIQKRKYEWYQFGLFCDDLQRAGLMHLARGIYNKSCVELPYEDKKEKIKERIK